MAEKILQLLSDADESPNSMSEFFGISKENLNYYLGKMVKDGLLSRYSNGIYDVTESGKKIHAELAENSGKKMIRLENIRFKFEIFDGCDSIIEYMKNMKKTELNHMTQYTGKIRGFSARVFVSNNVKILEITCEKELGENRYELYYQARKKVEDMIIGIMKEGKVRLGVAQHSMKPEWAIPHPFAKIILNTTESSQIRTKYGTMNISKGRNADWEVDDIAQAERIMNMPNVIEQINQKLDKVIQNTVELKPPHGLYM